MGYPLERKPRKDSQYETFTLSIDNGDPCAICESDSKAAVDNYKAFLGHRVALSCTENKVHAFHGKCIETWIKTRSICPTCKEPVSPEDRELIRTAARPRYRFFFDQEHNFTSDRASLIAHMESNEAGQKCLALFKECREEQDAHTAGSLAPKANAARRALTEQMEQHEQNQKELANLGRLQKELEHLQHLLQTPDIALTFDLEFDGLTPQKKLAVVNAQLDYLNWLLIQEGIDRPTISFLYNTRLVRFYHRKPEELFNKILGADFNQLKELSDIKTNFQVNEDSIKAIREECILDIQSAVKQHADSGSLSDRQIAILETTAATLFVHKVTLKSMQKSLPTHSHSLPPNAYGGGRHQYQTDNNSSIGDSSEESTLVENNISEPGYGVKRQQQHGSLQQHQGREYQSLPAQHEESYIARQQRQLLEMFNKRRNQ